MPLVWSVPEALVTAELATCFPSNAGFVEACGTWPYVCINECTSVRLA